MTVEEYQLALCLAGTTVENSAGEKRFVPLLSPEFVREKCPRCEGRGRYWNKGSNNTRTDVFIGGWIECLPCSNRGWVPATSIFPYLEAVYKFGKLPLEQMYRIAFSMFLGELATLKEVAKALGVDEKNRYTGPGGNIKLARPWG